MDTDRLDPDAPLPADFEASAAERQAIKQGPEALATLRAAYRLRLERFFDAADAAVAASGRTLAQRTADAATFALEAGLIKAIDELPRLRISRAAFERLPVFDLVSTSRRLMPDHAVRILFGEVWLVWRPSLAAHMLYRPSVPEPGRRRKRAHARERKLN